mmetsp:Transcript_5516/g.6070  ORF Transcript_5516/g.6070 Transcript_5516/m.6070 type:complete len:333 (-) Transcript_5516:115-1113(-)
MEAIHNPMDFDLNTNFNTVQEVCVTLEDCFDKKDEDFKAILLSLDVLSQKVQQLALFSSNEESDDIITEHLKFLLINYYKGDVAGRIMENRYRTLLISKICYEHFLTILDNMGMLPQSQKETWDAMDKEPADSRMVMSTMTRDQKITISRRKKEIKEKLKEAEKYIEKDEEVARDFYLMMIEDAVYRSLEAMDSMRMEMQILKFKEENPETADSIRSEKMDPKAQEGRKMQVFHIPAGGFGNYQAQIDMKQDVLDRVFKPGHNLPTMSLEEFAEMEVKEAMERSEKEKNIPKENSDSEDEEVSDRKTYKARHWDDWRDNNEKGAGNKKANIG